MVRGFLQGGKGKALLSAGTLALGLVADASPRVGRVVEKVGAVGQ